MHQLQVYGKYPHLRTKEVPYLEGNMNKPLSGIAKLLSSGTTWAFPLCRGPQLSPVHHHLLLNYMDAQLTLTSTSSALEISNKDTSEVVSQLLQLWCPWQAEEKTQQINRDLEILQSSITPEGQHHPWAPKQPFSLSLKVPGHCSSVIPDKRKTTYISWPQAPIAAAVFNCSEITPQI